MALLILGLALWWALHLMKSAAPELRAGIVLKIGEKPWAGVVAIGLVLSIVLMVQGFGAAATAGAFYTPPGWAVHANNLLMLIAFYLLGAGHMKVAVARYIRHPMLTAVVVWSAAHLLANGEVRSVILFGGIGVWAVVNMITINRRDGAWTPPPPSPMKKNLIHAGAALVTFAVFLLIHPWLFGVSPLPG